MPKSLISVLLIISNSIIHMTAKSRLMPIGCCARYKTRFLKLPAKKLLKEISRISRISLASAIAFSDAIYVIGITIET